MEEAKQTCVDYYTQLYDQSRENQPFQTWFPRIVFNDFNVWLARLPRMEEIKKVINKILADKAPWPDGYTIKFFQVYWEMVKHDVTTTLAHLFLGCNMGREVNHMFITLVHKIARAERMEDFWPISYVNSLYKIPTKLIVDRLSMVVTDLLSLLVC